MIWILLVIYQVKHFIADYPLQGRYMLGKFKPYPAFILPLLSHGLVHGAFTFLIALYLKPWQYALTLGALDMAIHSTVDWIKANPSIGGRFNALSKNEMKEYLQTVSSLSDAPIPRHPEIQLFLDNMKRDFAPRLKSNTFFWWALGADQMAHHLTHYLLIWMMLP
jgi:hypothetical protein